MKRRRKDKGGRGGKKRKKEDVLKARRAGTEASRLGQGRVGGGGQQEKVKDKRCGKEAAVGDRK